MKRRFKQAGMLTAIPIALLATDAHAQSATQFYGVLDVWAGPSQISGAGPSTLSVNSGGMQTSFWGIAGAEEVGRGVKVIYALESYIQVDSGTAGRAPNDAMFARNAYVGLQTHYGEVKLGRVLDPLFLATAQSNPFGGSIRLAPLMAQLWGPATGRTVYGDTSWDNAIVYTSPALGNVRAAVYGSLGETRYGAGTGNLGALLSYADGALTAFLSAQNVRVGQAVATPGQSQQASYFAGGSYRFDGWSAYASYNVALGAVPRSAARTGQLGVLVKAGSGNIMASWARTRNTGDGLADTRRNTGAVGYNYAASPRTELYAVLQTDRLSTVNRARTCALGMRHKF
ncbi:porin [Pseudoduganella sp. FT25W]|uniref:Porin n=1 Tax=Duganella alba TaxID=2666081 RepID=A0A6L5QKI8_9BURK|nr:porin [Duganella alba]MRX10314.1 porin [Duganella alba]MRX18601.1 porin [Duganella alba]